MKRGTAFSTGCLVMSLETVCAHCGTEYEFSNGHDCIPECYHCGVTYDEIDNPKYDSAKIEISRHQRNCEEQPEGWGENIRDIEAEWREQRRRKKRQQEWDRKIERKRRHGIL